MESFVNIGRIDNPTYDLKVDAPTSGAILMERKGFRLGV